MSDPERSAKIKMKSLLVQKCCAISAVVGAAIGSIFLFSVVTFGAFTIPYYYLREKPDAPIAMLFRAGFDTFGRELFMSVYIIVYILLACAYPLSMAALSKIKKKSE
jgi:hypothetical protein